MFVGQELYTPTNDSPIPVRGERPYAAILYVDLSVRPADETTLQVYTLRLGTTGHAALGDETQSWFHRLVPEFRVPLGWDHQIKSAPIMNAMYEYHRLALSTNRQSRVQMFLAPNGSLNIGNLFIAAKAAVDARAGYRVPHPWKRSDEATSGVRAYVIAGVQQEWIGYSLLLEGNTPETRDLVRKQAAVTEWYSGFCVGFSRASLEFRVITRTREYSTGPSRHVWGAIGTRFSLQ